MYLYLLFILLIHKGESHIATAKQNCLMPTDFQCGNSYCVAWNKRCDGKFDCYDHTDEVNCNCTGKFICSNGLCINSIYHCDGINNCYDNSDELNCQCGSTNSTFACLNGQCIPSKFVCDLYMDCTDESDEDHCVCSIENNRYNCNDGKCIDASQICNSVNDCDQGEDESACVNTNNGSCFDVKSSSEQINGCLQKYLGYSSFKYDYIYFKSFLPLNNMDSACSSKNSIIQCISKGQLCNVNWGDDITSFNFKLYQLVCSTKQNQYSYQALSFCLTNYLMSNYSDYEECILESGYLESLNNNTQTDMINCRQFRYELSCLSAKLVKNSPNKCPPIENVYQGLYEIYNNMQFNLPEPNCMSENFTICDTKLSLVNKVCQNIRNYVSVPAGVSPTSSVANLNPSSTSTNKSRNSAIMNSIKKSIIYIALLSVYIIYEE